MTEKAAVEVPAPVSGRVLSTTGAPGDMVPVGAELIGLETQPQADAAPLGQGAPAAAAPAVAAVAPDSAARARTGGNGAAAPHGAHAGAALRTERVATSPAVRRRAHEAGVDLRQVAGSGPNGRIVPKDLEAYVAHRVSQPTPLRSAPKAVPAARAAETRGASAAATEEIKVIGLRRVIAQRMSEAKRN